MTPNGYKAPQDSCPRLRWKRVTDTSPEPWLAHPDRAPCPRPGPESQSVCLQDDDDDKRHNVLRVSRLPCLQDIFTLGPITRGGQPSALPQALLPGSPRKRTARSPGGAGSWGSQPGSRASPSPVRIPGIAQLPWRQVACLHPQFSLQVMGPAAS